MKQKNDLLDMMYRFNNSEQREYVDENTYYKVAHKIEIPYSVEE